MRRPRSLTIILALALALRLLYGLALDPALPYRDVGGDSRLYLQMGYYLMTGYDYSQVVLPTAPVYLVFTGLLQRLFAPETAVLIIRIVQAGLGTATCYFAYRLARAISRRDEAGLIAAGVLAVSPILIIEAEQIMTETVYLFLVSAGLWAYVWAYQQDQSGKPAGRSALLLAAALLGLATLTRAALLLFPVGLAVHLLLVYGWRQGIRRAALLLLLYGLVVSTWTLVYKVKWDRWVIGSGGGFTAFLYIGATEWQGAAEVDDNLAEDAGISGELPTTPDEQEGLYREAFTSILRRDPAGWLARRLGELTGAYLQPHGTVYFPGDSLKDLAANWAAHDRSLAGLLRLTTTDGFWPKVVVYLLHYTGLLAGLAGMISTRRNWRVTLPLIGFIVYTSLLHLLLDAIPRYLFPTEVGWWIFAAAALAALIERLRRRNPATVPEDQVLSRG